MTEPTADELARWVEEHQPYPSRSLVGVAICRHCGDTALWPCEPTQLLALVAAQADQIAELRDGMFGWRKHYYDAWAERDASEAKVADLEAAAEHWERVMVVVTDQAAEYVTTFARVRALCDAYRANCDPTSRQAEVAELFRAALDGTEATP